MSRIPDENIALNESSYLDSFIVPSMAEYVAGTPNKIRAYGLWPFAGKSMTVFAAGMDCGEITISATGSIDIPLDVAGSLTTDRFNTVSANTGTFNGLDVTVANMDQHLPIVVGYNYTSKGQITRPVMASESGSRIGPSLGAKTRTHQIGVLLYQTQGISFGTNFTNLRPARFLTDGGTAYPITTLFSGVYWDNLDDTYSYDSMPCWQISRPYPATVLAINGYLETQEQ